MNNRERARTNCFDNMAAFGKAHASDIADAAAASRIITHNLRALAPARRIGIAVLPLRESAAMLPAS